MISAPRRLQLSIVIPCFNEEAVLPAAWQRLQEVLPALDADIEVVFVDDGSSDGTGEWLEELSQSDSRVVYLQLSRNFGHQAALTAGLDVAQGDAVVLMDADLQDPPELLLQFVDCWRAGGEIVYGKRVSRRGEHPIRLWATRWAYWILERSSSIPLTPEAGDFRLLDRRVVEALRELREPDRYLRGMVSWLGFRQVAVPYERQERAAGDSHYGWGKLFRLALDGWFSFSRFPLALTWLIGAAFVVAGGILGICAASRSRPEMWLIFAAMLSLSGLQFLCFGWQGECLSRTYLQGKHRPLYVLRKHRDNSRLRSPARRTGDSFAEPLAAARETFR